MQSFVRAMANRTVMLCAIAVTCVLSTMPARAQMTWGEEYARRVRATEQVAPLGDSAFGDNINLYNGTVSFKVTDISLPGNNALPVTLSRYYDPQDVSQPRFLGTTWDLDIPHISAIAPKHHSGGFPVPLSTIWAGVEWQNETYWSGDRLNMGGSGTDILSGDPDNAKRARPDNFSGFAPRTKDGWYFVATVNGARHGGGRSYTGYAPDGTVYTFDWLLERDYSSISHPTRTVNGAAPVLHRKKLMLYVSEIKDRFGNWVRYDWDGEQLKRIHSSDGRQIVLDMDPKDPTAQGTPAWGLKSATVGTRIWTYNGSNVTNPDGTKWLYQLEGPRLDVISYERISTGQGGGGGYVSEEAVYCSPASKFEAGQTAKYTVTHPSGAKAEYNFTPMRHGRTMVEIACLGGDPEVEQSGERSGYATYHDVWSLQSKKVVGAGLAEMNYTYTYVGLEQGYMPPADPTAFPYNVAGWMAANVRPAPNRKTVTVRQPDGTDLIHTFGKDFGIDEGFLLQVQTRKGGVIHKTVTNTYVTKAEALGLPFPESMGFSGVLFADRLPYAHRPLKSTTISQDGETWTSAVASVCNGNSTLCFDRFARPVVEMKYNSMGSSKSELTEYYDRTDKWLLGQVYRRLVSAGGQTLEASRTTYDASTALPVATWSPCLLGTGGQLCVQTMLSQMTYRFTDPNGPEASQHATLATVADGKNQVTTLSNWKRGIPQKIEHPATAAASAQDSVEEAEVNDDGTLKWVEDELNNRTCYAYDASGRLETVTYPSELEDHPSTCDTSKWLQTTYKFERPTSALPYGLPTDTWTFTVSTGNARKVVYLDAFWRPMVEEAFDLATASTSRSVSVKRYDVSGQLKFQSYPMRWLSDYATLNYGTYTSYDALGRVVQVDQDSEIGAATPTQKGVLLSSFTKYHPQGQVEVVNGRGVVSVTRFLSFDRPSTDMPVEIRQATVRVGDTTTPVPAEEAFTVIGRDPFGLPLTLTRRNRAGTVSAVRSYNYDALRRLVCAVSPETGATRMGWDDNGNPLWTAAGLSGLTGCSLGDTDPALVARKVTRTYDARNRVTGLSFPDGRGNQAWTYFADGMPATITTYNGSGNTEPVINAYAYNRRRQLAGESVSQPGRYTWNMGYGYNSYGYQSVSLTQPSGEVLNFAPNALGQTMQVTSSLASYATGVSYHPNGTLAQFTYGNGIVHTMTQNYRGLPSLSADKRISDGKWVHQDAYEYDQVGNVMAIIDTATDRSDAMGSGDRDMTYDKLDRLITTNSSWFAGTTGTIARYSYDTLDNLTRVVARDRDQYYCYDGRQQLTSIRTLGCNTGMGATVHGLEYGLQGNLSNKDGVAHMFDFGNRLRSISGKESYRYDGHGRRVQATSATGLGDILSQYGFDGVLRYQQDFRRDVVFNHVYLAGSLIAIRETPMGTSTHSIKYQHTDALGTPVVVTNGSGAVIERNKSEPYGLQIGGVAKDGPGYAGHVGDRETGLTYMQQRYYDPSIGRFLSVDPVSTSVDTGANFNRYKYAANSPYSYVDPDGRLDENINRNCNMSACGTATIVKTTSAVVVDGTRDNKTVFGKVTRGDVRANTTFEGVVEGKPGGSLGQLHPLVSSALFALRDKTGYEYQAVYGWRLINEVAGAVCPIQFAAQIQTQSARAISFGMFAPEGYRAVVLPSGGALTMHNHGRGQLTAFDKFARPELFLNSMSRLGKSPGQVGDKFSSIDGPGLLAVPGGQFKVKDVPEGYLR